MAMFLASELRSLHWIPVQKEGQAQLNARRDPCEIVFPAERRVGVLRAKKIEGRRLINEIPRNVVADVVACTGIRCCIIDSEIAKNSVGSEMPGPVMLVSDVARPSRSGDQPPTRIEPGIGAGAEVVVVKGRDPPASDALKHNVVFQAPHAPGAR